MDKCLFFNIKYISKGIKHVPSGGRGFTTSNTHPQIHAQIHILKSILLYLIKWQKHNYEIY